MAKILGIVGSHRYLGNCEILVKEVAKAAGPEHELELLRLDEYTIKPCRGCYKCTMSEDGKCVQDDDLNFIAEKIAAADAVILSAPTYIRGLSGIVKTLGDRVIAIDQRLDQLWKKPAVVISTYGPEGDSGYALTALIAMARFLALDVKDAHAFLGALPGESLKNEGGLERAQQMGRALFGEARKPDEGECPYCWGNLWKFRKPDEAECPLCLTPARFTVVDGKIKVTYGESPTQVYGYEWLDKHFRADLSAGVKDFATTKATLKAIRDQYKGEYTWIKKESQ